MCLICFQILSKDSVTVTVDAVVYFRVYDPTMSIVNVANYQGSTKLLAATTLRNILGTKVRHFNSILTFSSEPMSSYKYVHVDLLQFHQLPYVRIEHFERHVLTW